MLKKIKRVTKKILKVKIEREKMVIPLCFKCDEYALMTVHI